MTNITQQHSFLFSLSFHLFSHLPKKFFFAMSGKKQIKYYSSSSSGKLHPYEQGRAFHEKRDTYLQQMLLENQRRALERRAEMARLRRENLAKGFAALDAELPESNPRRTQVRVLNDATEYVRVLKHQAGEDMMRDEEDEDEDM
ncbi:hypothetical protein K492DRAFT_198676 [Lichtheimia hyalospora FSU 10163]|nr:hypothetical protein K492DRAFT_198676 [Lichtheimia hyalospora FSU 10163]